MTTGHKIGRPGKGSVEELELDTPADAQILVTQVAKRQVDDPGEDQKAKRQKGEKSATKNEERWERQRHHTISRTCPHQQIHGPFQDHPMCSQREDQRKAYLGYNPNLKCNLGTS